MYIEHYLMDCRVHVTILDLTMSYRLVNSVAYTCIIQLVILQGVMAIHSPYTGIVDYSRVTNSYADDFMNRGGQVYTDFKVCLFGSFL